MKTLLFAVVIFLSVISKAQDSGVLLGFLKDDGGEARSYETYWVGMKGEKPFVSGPLNDLLVPTKDGFYRVGTKAGCVLELNVDTAELMYVVRPDQQPVVLLQSCADAEKNLEISLKKEPLKEGDVDYDDDPREVHNEIKTRIKLVTSKSILYLKADRYLAAVHEDSRIHQILIRSFDGANSGYFHKFQQKDFIPDAKAIIPEDEQEKECIENNAGNYEWVTWSVRRNPFAWEFEGYLPTHRLCGVGVNFKSAIRVDTPEVGPLVPGGIIAQLFGKKDGFVSPDGQVVVSIDESGFEIYSVKKGKLVSVFKKSSKLGQLVMQEWASGKTVDQWDMKFTGILKNKWKDTKYEKYDSKIHPGRKKPTNHPPL